MENLTICENIKNSLKPVIRPAREIDILQLKSNREKEKIAFEKSQSWVGKTYEMLIEGYDLSNKVIAGRIWRDAPEVDGLVIAEGLPTEDKLSKIKITSATAHDLFGIQLK